MSGVSILSIAHGHPDFSPGGGEIAALTLHEAYARLPEVARATFLASHMPPRQEYASGAINLHKPGQYLWNQRCRDYFLMDCRNLDALTSNFRDFLAHIQPDIVHIHHGMHLGYEIIEAARRYLPDARIAMTLHEFVPICARNGHMLRKDDRLCNEADIHACHACQPEHSLARHWLRRRRFQHFLSLPHLLISPSEFLRQRYIAWGIEPERIVTLENALRPLPRLAPRPLREGETRSRFAFFGQIFRDKGLHLLLNAIMLLPEKTRQNMTLEIHGVPADIPQAEYLNDIDAKIAKLNQRGIVRFIGSYDKEELPERMAGIDWVLAPSIWWENSPVVIQEALAMGRPVLATGIGGMAEKVNNGVNGLHVPARNAQAWADAMAMCCGNDELWNRLTQCAGKRKSADEVAREHLEILGNLC